MSDNADKMPSSDAWTHGRDTTSEIFELITRDDVHFYVHKDILTSQSEPFQQATTGPWKEATDRKIHLVDWDTDTVARLVEFLYSDDYTYPDPTPLDPGPAPQANTPGPSKPIVAHLDELLDRSPVPPIDLSRLFPTRGEKVTDSQRLEAFDPAEYDFEKVLLVHARVYVLANYKGVEFLKVLALKRVLLVLLRLQPLQVHSHIVRNVAEFAGYVYANTDLLNESEEPLRQLASQFIAMNVVPFQKEPRAVRLMAEGGDLVTDTMSKLCGRIVGSDNNLSIRDTTRRRYISNVTVHRNYYGGSNVVKELHGLANTFNNGNSKKDNVFLVVEYTAISKDACTGFQSLSVAVGEDPKNTNDRKSSLVVVKDLTECAKVTDVAVIRSSSDAGLDFEKIKQYDGMSDDLNAYRGGDSLYLLWRTAKTGLV